MTMRYRFAEFELDEQLRELRLQGRELKLQPRVFDVLAYLLGNRDRVVDKAELLDALWPGMVVVDGALQRVISLARAALREGGAASAIRTYARRGYRFCLDTVQVDAGTPAPEAPAGAAEALDRRAWEHAADAFRSADDVGGLSADALERWAQALQYAGRSREAVPPLERAVAAYAMAGKRQSAARAALWLAQIQFEQRDLAVSDGWLKRAARLLENEPRCREAGLLAWLRSRTALACGDLDAARLEAERTLETGRALHDTGLETLGLVFLGHALLAAGEVQRGAQLHDEAAAAVLSGAVQAWVGGIVYCSVIWGCRNRSDWQRASQWTEQFTRWCRETGLDGYPGTCRLHRAEVLSMCGALHEAEQEASAARETLAVVAPWAEGDAWRLLGDLCLGRGDPDAAGPAYRRAHALGWDANPGYARVLLARGRVDAALRSLEQSLADPVWANRERRGLLLAELAGISAAHGRLERARSALAELEGRSQLWDTPAMTAYVHRARAELASAEGRTGDAVAGLRRAQHLWREIGSPLHLADACLRLAGWLAGAGDPDGAELEVATAESLLQAIDAPARLAQCAALRGELAGGDG